MTDEQLDQLLRDAGRSYNAPPDNPPLEAIWQGVERDLAAGTGGGDVVDPQVIALTPRRSSVFVSPWLRIAAALVVGVALGRVSAVGTATTPAAAGATTVTERAASVTGSDDPTHRYFGQAAALLLTLPSELRAPSRSPAYAASAKDLLLETRLMLDAPMMADPGMHALLEDLEVVLAQVVRLSAATDDDQRDILTEALVQSDAIPRLRDVVVERLGD